jgi:hypothetical protein
MRTRLLLLATLLAASGLTAVSADDGRTVRVTVDNFCRAETDTYFAKFVAEGGFGKVKHQRELAPIDKQTVIRMNRDTLYSFGVFDLDAAPVTITLPGAGKRYMALQVINEDHYATEVVYAPGVHTLTKEKVGTRYVAALVRTFVNPNDAASGCTARARRFSTVSGRRPKRDRRSDQSHRFLEESATRTEGRCNLIDILMTTNWPKVKKIREFCGKYFAPAARGLNTEHQEPS